MADCEKQQLIRIARCHLVKAELGEDYSFSGDGNLGDKAHANSLISVCGERNASCTKTKKTYSGLDV